MCIEKACCWNPLFVYVSILCLYLDYGVWSYVEFKVYIVVIIIWCFWLYSYWFNSCIICVRPFICVTYIYYFKRCVVIMHGSTCMRLCLPFLVRVLTLGHCPIGQVSLICIALTTLQEGVCPSRSYCDSGCKPGVISYLSPISYYITCYGYYVCNGMNNFLINLSSIV